MPGAISATIEAWAIPAQHIPAVDHTYVASSCGYKWGCFGRDSGGTLVVPGGTGDSNIAECLSHPRWKWLGYWVRYARTLIDVMVECATVDNVWDCGEIVMKKRQFLAPLAASVAALLGGAVVPAQASSAPVVTAPEASAQAVAVDHLVLTRSATVGVQLADHESHASHESHSSHASGS